AEDGIRDFHVTGVQTCALPISAVNARTGADVEDIIGGQDRVLIVLNDDNGIAEVAQALKSFEEARIVPLVQPDRGLVENVEHAEIGRASCREGGWSGEDGAGSA